MKNNNEKIKPQEERRRTVKYGYDENFPNGFENDVLRCGCGSVYGTLPGGERKMFKENKNFLYHNYFQGTLTTVCKNDLTNIEKN